MKKIKEEQTKHESKTPTKDGNEENIKTKLKFKELLHTITPTLRIENWFGIFRFCFINDELVPAKRKHKLISLLITLGYVLLFAFFLNIPSAISGTGKLVDVMDDVPSIVILTQYVSSAIRTTFFLNQPNIRIFKTLSELDSKLHISKSQKFYQKARKTNMIFLYLLIFLHIIVISCDLFTRNNEGITISEIIVLPIYMEQNLELFIFCLMISMLRSRLIIINKCLHKFIEEKDKNSVYLVTKQKESPEEFNVIGRSSPDNMKIRDLGVTYDMIGETCSLINDAFNFQIFMSLVATFTYIVITIWTSLYYYRTPGSYNGAIITIIIWCTTAIFFVACMSLICEKLLITRNKTKILVNRVIMDYDLPNSMRVQAKAFMELIEAWPLRIFIYDMFSVDITLMLKYISVATTYLIVIIQISHFL